MCTGEYPNNITVSVLNPDDALLVYSSTTLLPIISDQMMFVTGYASLILPNNVNVFIVNVSLSNKGGEFNDVTSFKFGKTCCCLHFYLFVIGPVANIKSEIDNCTTISVSWESPYINRLSIVYYNLRIYSDSNNQLVRSVSVYDTSFQFEGINFYINHYTYIITGVNKLGEEIPANETFTYQRGTYYTALYNMHAYTCIVPKTAKMKDVVVTLLNYTNDIVNYQLNLSVSYTISINY